MLKKEVIVFFFIHVCLRVVKICEIEMILQSHWSLLSKLPAQIALYP